MKKNILSKLIFIILIIILVIAVVVALNQNNAKDLTKNFYDKICNNEEYTFSMTTEEVDTNYILTVVKKEDNMSIDVVAEDDHTTTLLKEGYLYYLIHEDEEYYLYEAEDVDINILKEDFQEIEGKDYETGTEKIDGEKYYYEEYTGIASFVLLLHYEDESEVKTRFYYENEELKYIETIVDDDSELLKIEFLENADESYLEIPGSYAEL